MREVLISSVIWLALCVAASAQSVEPWVLSQNPFVRELERTIGTPANPTRDQCLKELRQLRDPELRPLFGQLAASRDAALRRHGVLGLAMLEKQPRINALMVANLPSPAERTDVLLAALDESLIAPGQIDDILAWPGLDERVEVRLRARRAAEALTPDVGRLTTLSASDDSTTAALALCLLVCSGENSAYLKLEERLDRLTAIQRLQLIEQLCQTFSEDSHQQAAGVVSWLVQNTSEEERSVELISTLLALSPAEGCSLFQTLFSRAGSLGAKLRLAMAALAQSARLTPECFEPMLQPGEDSLVRTVAAVGQAISGGSDPLKPIDELLKRRYGPASRWIVEWAAARNDQLGADVLARVIQAWMDREVDATIDRAVVDAARYLAAVSTEALMAKLKAAAQKGDGAICAALLYGISESNVPVDFRSIAPVDWPSDESAAMATVLEAVSQLGSQSPDINARLRRIMSGWGGLPVPVRAKAAWLALRVEGIQREALAVVLVSLE